MEIIVEQFHKQQYLLSICRGKQMLFFENCIVPCGSDDDLHSYRSVRGLGWKVALKGS